MKKEILEVKTLQRKGAKQIMLYGNSVRVISYARLVLSEWNVLKRLLV